MLRWLAIALLLCTHAVGLGRKLSSRRRESCLRLSNVATTSRSPSLSSPLAQFDYVTNDKLPWLPEGYETWSWRGHKINFVEMGGPEPGRPQKPPLLLIHGFGASVFHWRYNIPELARKYHVFAIDLLGFGLSDKPLIEYTPEVWRDEALDFIREIVRPRSNNAPCVVAGNSLGGFTALYAAAEASRLASAVTATAKDRLINGAILVNAAGSFKATSPDTSAEDAAKPEWQKAISAAVQRFVINLSFIYTKQPLRIAQVLRQVYPVDQTNVDDELVESIRYPAQGSTAAEVFYRVIKKNGNGPPVYVDDLLETLTVPLLLLWGEQDPWIRPAAADRIQSLYPQAKRVSVNAGHCAHDEAPKETNAAIAEFMSSL